MLLQNISECIYLFVIYSMIFIFEPLNLHNLYSLCLVYQLSVIVMDSIPFPKIVVNHLITIFGFCDNDLCALQHKI